MGLSFTPEGTRAKEEKRIHTCKTHSADTDPKLLLGISSEVILQTLGAQNRTSVQ